MALFACPKCTIQLNVPDEYRGKVIRCLECHSQWLSPRIDVDQPQLKPVPLAFKTASFPPHVFIPMIALMLLGAAGLLVNTYYAVQFNSDPASIVRYSESNLSQMNATSIFTKKEQPEANIKMSAKRDDAQKAGGKKSEPVDPQILEQKRKEDELKLKQNANELAAKQGENMKKMMYLFAGVSLLALLGGISFAYGKWSILAWIGCIAAILNINHSCCFPGAIAGIWGILTLISTEGQKHFGKSIPINNKID